MMRQLPTNEEWSLEWLAGIAKSVAVGKSTQAHLDGARRLLLVRLHIDPLKVELTIRTRKAPRRCGNWRNIC